MRKLYVIGPPECFIQNCSEINTNQKLVSNKQTESVGKGKLIDKGVNTYYKSVLRKPRKKKVKKCSTKLRIEPLKLMHLL